MWVYRYGEISHIPTVSETSSCYTQYGIADLAQELSFGTVVLVEERFWCITTRAGAGIIESPLLEWNISADKI